MTLQEVIRFFDEVTKNLKAQIKTNKLESKNAQLVLLNALGKPPSQNKERDDARFNLIAAATRNRVLHEVMESLKTTQKTIIENLRWTKRLAHTHPYQTRAVA